MLVEINDDEIQRVVVNFLKQCYIDVNAEKNSKWFEDIHESEQRHIISTVHGIECCLRYLMMPSDAEAFITLHKDYRHGC